MNSFKDVFSLVFLSKKMFFLLLLL